MPITALTITERLEAIQKQKRTFRHDAVGNRWTIANHAFILCVTIPNRRHWRWLAKSWFKAGKVRPLVVRPGPPFLKFWLIQIGSNLPKALPWMVYNWSIVWRGKTNGNRILQNDTMAWMEVMERPIMLLLAVVPCVIALIWKKRVTSIQPSIAVSSIPSKNKISWRTRIAWMPEIFLFWSIAFIGGSNSWSKKIAFKECGRR